MPANKIGRLWKFKKNEIDEWVRTNGASEKGAQLRSINEKQSMDF